MTRKKRMLTKVKVAKAKPTNDDHQIWLSTAADYFALPKYKRCRWGFWYKTPNNFTAEDWEIWEKKIREEFPLQGWWREWALSYDNPVYKFIDQTWLTITDGWYRLKCLFNPKHQVIRDAIPFTWRDITELIVEVNFAMIKDFYYGEVVKGIINWDATPDGKKFILWIKKAIKYIETDRPQLLIDRDNAYPKVDSLKDNHISLYKKVNQLEDKIYKKDTALLKQLAEKRGFFWT